MIQIIHVMEISSIEFQKKLNQTIKELDVVDIKYAVAPGMLNTFTALVMYKTNKARED